MKELDPRIRIRAPLRCDGIGRLDCAEDTVSGQRLAVRWLPLDANGDAAVKACEKLPAHPTLPRIHQTGQVGGSAFVALDFPNGELLSANGEEPLETDALLKMASQLCDALATVHAQGVVHGEMSRDSVLLTHDGRAFLWDMPLVIANRLSDRRGENRLMQNLVKTAPFLSPERARGEGASQAGDVYALGAILCVAAGAPLPSSSTTLAVVHLVAAGTWMPQVPESMPEPWRSMVARMISRDPAQRPTAADVALAFARVPNQNMMPTVPEMAAVKLPAEILAAAEALMKSQVEALRAPTREVPVAVPAEALPSPVATNTAPALELSAQPVAPAVELGAQPDAKTDQQPALAPVVEAPVEAGPALLPVAADPLPELNLNVLRQVQPHTLDEVHEASPDVVRIPTIELKAIELESSPAVAVVTAPPEVQLTDNVTVSHELAAAGAMALSDDEVRAIHAGQRKVWVLFGSIAAAALVLMGLVVWLAMSPSHVTVAQPAPAPVAPAVEVAAPAPKTELADELVPLPRLPARPAPAPRATSTKAVESAPGSTAAVVKNAKDTEEPAESIAAPAKATDFSFLEAEAQPQPQSELKRPSSEL